MRRLFEMLKLKVGDKPAWAIVVAAVLAAVGSAIAAALIATGQAGLSAASRMVAGGESFSVIVRDAHTSLPLDGAQIELLDLRTLKPMPLNASKATSLTTKGGVAHTMADIPPGEYAIRAEYRHEDTTYGRFDPVMIKGAFTTTLEFDPATWFTKQMGTVTPVRNSILPPAITNPSAGLPWMAIAEGELGQVEDKRGNVSNPRIQAYITASGQPTLNDDHPWQGAFVNWTLQKAGYSGPKSPMVARNWLQWGRPVTVAPGCIAVFWRGSPDSFLGHVGFVVGEDKDSLRILGGNQNDAVSIVHYPRARLLSCRMPSERP